MQRRCEIILLFVSDELDGTPLRLAAEDQKGSKLVEILVDAGAEVNPPGLEVEVYLSTEK